MTNQNSDKAKRFFEYLLALSTLNGNKVQSKNHYEKSISWKGLQETDGCKKGNNNAMLLEMKKPKIDRSYILTKSPYPELDRWIDSDMKKEIFTPTYKNILKINEKIFQLDGPIQINRQQLTEWKRWIDIKKKVLQANNFYDELLQICNMQKQESEEIEVVLSKGILKWPSKNNEQPKELPLFTAKVNVSVHPETGVITITDETEQLKFETNILVGKNSSNRDKIHPYIEKLEKLTITDDLSNEFKYLAKLIDPKCQFIDSPQQTYDMNAPVILNQSLLIVRRIGASILNEELQDIIHDIDQNRIELPTTIQTILGEPPNNQTKPNTILQSAYQTYLPYDLDEQQKDIIQQLQYYDGVTVQANPGIKKSHAIANLITNYLAEGKKILITSKENLAVEDLKNSLPEEIRDLCAPVVTDEYNSPNEMEQSISVIGEKLAQLDVQKVQENILRNQQLYHLSKQKEELYKNSLQKSAKTEGTPIVYRNQELFKSDVAKRLAESTVDYHWIKDELPLVMKFPLSDVEWADFCSLQNGFKPEDSLLINTNLPSLQEDILSESTFKSLIEEEQQYIDEIDVQYVLPIELSSSIKSTLLIMRSLVEDIIKSHPVLEDKSYSKLIYALLTEDSRKERFVQLIDELKQFNEKAIPLYHEVVDHKFSLPKKLYSEIQNDLWTARERILSGKKPNQFFFIGKGKNTKYLFQTGVLNGHALRSIEDVTLIEKHLEYLKLITKLSRIFNQNMSEIGVPEIDITHPQFPLIMEERLNILTQIINITNLEIELAVKLQSIDLLPGNIFNLTFYENLKKEINHSLKYIKYANWQEEYQEELDMLVHLANSENVHGIAKRFLQALKERDVLGWLASIKELKKLQKTAPNIKKWQQYANRLSEKLPHTVEHLTNQFGIAKLDKNHHMEAFVLKKMETWLQEEVEIDYNTLNKQLQQERKIQEKLRYQIISDAIWSSQIIRLTEDEKNALSEWKTNSKKKEKSIWKNTSKLEENIKESLKKAQSAIPVWVTPIDQIHQQVPNLTKKFDLIIIEGGNENDVFAIKTFVKAQKVLVVGDSSKHSLPESVLNVNAKKIEELQNHFIQEIPKKSLYTGEKSLYEIAEQHFPKIVLGDSFIYSIKSYKNTIGRQSILAPENLEQLCPSLFEVDVLKAIASRGYQVIPQVKVGSYTFALIVEGLNNRLAIECDAKKWQGIKAYQETSKKREALEKSGWNFWHINSKEFYENQDKALETLWPTLKQLGIFPNEAEENKKLIHDFSLNAKTKQKPSIQFHIQQKKVPNKNVQENKLD
ncbi:hypothetical protein ACWV26_07480 [Rummeliibacillus sp. JY-2-4R]